MVWANVRVPSCAAVAFAKAIWPLTAIKNAGLASKYLIHAVGPSWVTEWETACMNARTNWSTDEAPSGVTGWEWLAPAAQGTQAANVTANSTEQIRRLRERDRTTKMRVEEHIENLHRPPRRNRER